MQISPTKAQLLAGAAVIRPTARERSMGRLMRSEEGHGTPTPSAAPAPTPTPTPTPAATDGTALGGGAEEAGGTDETALGGKAAEPDATAKPGEKTAEEIAAEEAAAKGAEVPEAYDLTAPEGMALDASAIELATPVFKELGLSNEQANKLMPVAAQFAQGLMDKHNTAILSQIAADRKAWLDSAKADPEIGGGNWDKTLASGAGALDRLGFTKGTPFRVLLDESGLGNHPEMIRAWSKVGAAIGDDPDFVRGGAHQPKRDRAETLYPEDKPKGG